MKLKVHRNLSTELGGHSEGSTIEVNEPDGRKLLALGRGLVELIPEDPKPAVQPAPAVVAVEAKAELKPELKPAPKAGK